MSIGPGLLSMAPPAPPAADRPRKLRHVMRAEGPGCPREGLEAWIGQGVTEGQPTR
jgi:hypothetical protein